MTDIREDKYDQAIADELREVAASIGGGDSISGLMILGLVNEYEMAPDGPCAHLRRPDIREEFARIAESRRKPPISGSNIGYNCAIDEMIAELRALPSVCGGEWQPISEYDRKTYGSGVIGWNDVWGVAEFMLHDDGWVVGTFNGTCKRSAPQKFMRLPPPPDVSSPPPVSAREEVPAQPKQFETRADYSVSPPVLKMFVHLDWVTLTTLPEASLHGSVSSLETAKAIEDLVAAARRKITGPSAASIRNAIAAMEPFERFAEWVDEGEWQNNGYTKETPDDEVIRSTGTIGRDYAYLTMGDCRRVRSALAALKREVETP